jgi:RNA-directed DNA polymerase
MSTLVRLPGGLRRRIRAANTNHPASLQWEHVPHVTITSDSSSTSVSVTGAQQKPLIRPSKAAVRRIRQRLQAELRSLRGHNARAVIRRLNPIIRGWAAYYRRQVSSNTFDMLDHYLWALTYRWALLSHRNKSRPWVFARYFGKFNRSREDRWVFGDRKTGAYLHRFGWTGIVRHQLVRYRASPDDPDLTEILGLATTSGASHCRAD